MFSFIQMSLLSTVSNGTHNSIIKIFLIVAIWVILFVIVGTILYSLYLLAKQKHKIKDFGIERALRKRVSFYKQNYFLNPLFIENDIEQFIESELDSHLSWINLIIGSLSVLGLLGTFLGLSGALVVLKDVLDSPENLSSLTGMIAGAFITSILGLMGSLGLNIFQRINHKSIDKIILEMRSRIFEAVFNVESQKQVDFSILAESIEASFQAGIEKLIVHNAEAYGELKDFSKQLIHRSAEKIYTMVNSNEANLEAVIEKLDEERKAIDSVKKNWNQAIDQLHQSSVNIKSMTQNLNNFSSISEKLIDTLKEYGENFHSQVSILRQLESQLNRPSDLMKNLSVLISESINQGNKSHEQSIANQIFTENMVKNALENASRMIEEITKTVHVLNAGFGEQLKTIEENSRNGQLALQESLKKTNTDLMEKLGNELQIIRNSFQAINQETITIIRDTAGILEKVMPNQENQLSKINQSFHTLDARLKRAFEAIINREIS